MSRRCYVTTSWDDGHPCDLRLAELLARFAIPATFYIPAAGQRRCLPPAAVRTLGQAFELGAHTLRHLPLDNLPDAEAAGEMAGSREYLEQLLGRRCRLFAPPKGRFRRRHLRMAECAGFRGFRTTELMSLALPRRRGGLAVMPTTLQLYPHGPLAYCRNAVRRLRPANLWLYARQACRRDLAGAWESLLDYAVERGGVLHLWGHSWEIDEWGLWDLLDEMLRRLAARRDQLRLVSNSALCHRALAYARTRRVVSAVVLP